MKSLVYFLTLLAVIVTPLRTLALEKVAVIDTGLNPTDRRFSENICKGHVPWDFVHNAPLVEDFHGHGTHVAGLIKKYAGSADFCFLIYRYYQEGATGAQNLRNEISAMRKAVTEGATIVNISGGGPEFSESEYLIIKGNPQIKFVVAAGNEHQNIDFPSQEYYPASYRLSNVISVGAKASDCKSRLTASNYGNTVKFWELGENVRSTLPTYNCRRHPPGDARCASFGLMSGTSQATAIHTGKILSGRDKEGCTIQTSF